MEYIIKTSRLGLRRWSSEDLPAFHAINSDARVMRYFPSTLSMDQSRRTVDKFMTHFDRYDYGFYAVDLLEADQFIGFIGFSNPNFETWFTPCIEIGWRLSQTNWNQGLATEGAQACLQYGFEVLGFEEVFSFTSSNNLPSMRVMQKLNMTLKGEFDHPLVSPGHELSRHVVYHLSREIYVNQVRIKE